MPIRFQGIFRIGMYECSGNDKEEGSCSQSNPERSVSVDGEGAEQVQQQVPTDTPAKTEGAAAAEAQLHSVRSLAEYSLEPPKPSDPLGERPTGDSASPNSNAE